MIHSFLRTASATLLLIALASSAVATVDLVVVDAPKDKVWVGQKASVHVKLRGKGPFVGAASFSLPEVPRTVILKVGTPVVSSEEIEGDSWFVQDHEFALFSQADGVVKVPAFEVRFANRDGFTGPAHDHIEQVPAIEFQVQRPQGSDPSTFLVTTESLKVEQQWDPEPGQAEQGAVFHRTITQQADQVTGMALAPPPTKMPDGVSVHFADPTIADNTDRGAFTGSRTDRITYVLEQPGTVTLPAIQYVWWNPDRQEYGSTTLPAATFEVAAIATPADEDVAEAMDREWMLWLALVLVASGLCYWQRHRLAECLTLVWEKINPPEQRVARKLLRACQQSDARAAEAAWIEWQAAGSTGHGVTPRLSAAATDLQRVLYGAGSQAKWDGSELAAAFAEVQAMSHAARTPDEAELPQLNPTRS